MLKIRMAAKDDVKNMIDLWAETRNWEFKNPRYEEDWLAAPVSYVLELADRLERSIEDGMVMVAYDGRYLVGFSVTASYTPEGQAPECLFLNEIYVSKTIQEADIASELIRQIGKKAAIEGYQRMSIGISSDRRDNLKEQCIRLGAKYTWTQGLNYCYYENYEWRDLSVFL